ncbi:hypothetical protein [Streptomyces sp. NPDC014894]|uniref:hypothetical protein n=1 Tax=Streptomyces sp. NPDC014894 TaxID=3364931 RepID=UPI0036FC1F29
MQTSALGGVRTPATPEPISAARHGGGTPPGDRGRGRCDLVTVPARQGLEAVDILRRTAAPAVGPVLHDGGCDTLGFLVPPGTADGWDLPGSACTRTADRAARTPAEPPVRGTGWLLPPDDTDQVTDPAVLRHALGEAARLIAAADSRR